MRHIFFAPLVVLSAPASAFACAVCGMGGPGNNSWAYFSMTMLLSGLPLAMIGGVVYWAVRRSRSNDDTSVGENLPR